MRHAVFIFNFFLCKISKQTPSEYVICVFSIYILVLVLEESLYYRFYESVFRQTIAVLVKREGGSSLLGIQSFEIFKIDKENSAISWQKTT